MDMTWQTWHDRHAFLCIAFLCHCKTPARLQALHHPTYLPFPHKIWDSFYLPSEPFLLPPAPTYFSHLWLLLTHVLEARTFPCTHLLYKHFKLLVGNVVVGGTCGTYARAPPYAELHEQ